MSDAASAERKVGRKGWVLEQPDDCGHQPDGSFVLQLEQPIRLGTGTPTERLSFRPAKGKDLRTVPSELKTLDPLFVLASRLCGRPLAELDDLCAADAAKVMEIVGFFMAGSTGEIGSSPKDFWRST